MASASLTCNPCKLGLGNADQVLADGPIDRHSLPLVLAPGGSLIRTVVTQGRKDEVYGRVSFREPYSGGWLSVVAVCELEISPALALDPQRHEDVFHRNEFLAELHSIGGERRRLVAGQRHARRVVDEDAPVAA